MCACLSLCAVKQAALEASRGARTKHTPASPPPPAITQAPPELRQAKQTPPAPAAPAPPPQQVPWFQLSPRSSHKVRITASPLPPRLSSLSLLSLSRSGAYEQSSAASVNARRPWKKQWNAVVSQVLSPVASGEAKQTAPVPAPQPPPTPTPSAANDSSNGTPVSGQRRRSLGVRPRRAAFGTAGARKPAHKSAAAPTADDSDSDDEDEDINQATQDNDRQELAPGDLIAGPSSPVKAAAAAGAVVTVTASADRMSPEIPLPGPPSNFAGWSQSVPSSLVGIGGGAGGGGGVSGVSEEDFEIDLNEDDMDSQ